MYDVATRMRELRNHAESTADTIEQGKHDHIVVTWGSYVEAIKEDSAEFGKAMTRIRNYVKELNADKAPGEPGEA